MPRIVVDPITRIEGHLRIEAQTNATDRNQHAVRERVGCQDLRSHKPSSRFCLQHRGIAG